MKTMLHIILSALLFIIAPGSVFASDATALPEAFKKNIPLEFADGLQLLEVKKRCEDCPPWRYVDFRDNKQPEPTRREKISVQAGYTAMYAFPGTHYFANTKIEQSVSGSYDNDKSVVIDAIKHEYARKKELVAEYLQANPKAKERADAALAKGKEYIDFETETYKGFEYVSYTENVIGLTGATISQLHIFSPKSEITITAYLLKQSKSKFNNIDEFLKLRREFIEGYIDFLVAKSGG